MFDFKVPKSAAYHEAIKQARLVVEARNVLNAAARAPMIEFTREAVAGRNATAEQPYRAFEVA